MFTKHILNILTTWRITEILIDEEGIFDISATIRHYAMLHGANSIIPDYDTGKMKKADSKIWHEVYEILQCRWCCSVWVGITIASITGVNPLYGFSYSAASLLFGKLFNAIPTYIHGEVESQVFDNGD